MNNRKINAIGLLLKISLLLLPLATSSCHEDPPEKIKPAGYIVGTWESFQRIDWEIDANSTWHYHEIEKYNSGEWLNIPYTFNEDGSYFIEFREADDHIVKYKGLYEWDGDTIRLSGVEDFPCHDALAEMSTTKSLSLIKFGVNENNNLKTKIEIQFTKRAEKSKENAIPNMPIRLGMKFICSANNHSYLAKMEVENVTVSSVQLLVEGEHVVLTADEPILCKDPYRYLSCSAKKAAEDNNHLTSILYYSLEENAFYATTYLDDDKFAKDKIKIKESIGEVFFWETK